MKEQSEILSRVGRNQGMTAPDGYFAGFAERMAASLPDYPQQDASGDAPRTFWQKIRPYAYMAAMFAGIWCMLKMFSMMGGGSADLSIDNYPSVITALSDDRFVRDAMYGDFDQYDIIEDIIGSEDVTPEEFFDFSDWDTTSKDSGTTDFNLPSGSDL